MATTTKTFNQPQCSHYCEGECWHEGRQSASAPCPFDGSELPMVDSESVFFDENFLRPWLAAPALPEKG